MWVLPLSCSLTWLCQNPQDLGKGIFRGPHWAHPRVQGENLESIFLIKALSLGHDFSAVRDQVFLPSSAGPQHCAGLHQKLGDEHMRITFALF